MVIAAFSNFRALIERASRLNCRPLKRSAKSAASTRALPDGLLESTEPVVLRGVVAPRPMVSAALESVPAAIRYLSGFYRDATVGVMLGEPAIEGRFFYNEDLSGFNFKSVMLRLDAVLEDISRHASSPQPRSIYVGSTTIDSALPGFREHNDIDLGTRNALASIWIGNRTRIAAHHDLPDNLACVAAGRRRFTLFPPKQIENLYVGPLDLTPAGQAISWWFREADYARFPRFAQAVKAARGRTRAWRCGAHSEHVVASRRVTRLVQRARQLLVAPVAGSYRTRPSARW
jgi:hypothetical protein